MNFKEYVTESKEPTKYEKKIIEFFRQRMFEYWDTMSLPHSEKDLRPVYMSPEKFRDESQYSNDNPYRLKQLPDYIWEFYDQHGITHALISVHATIWRAVDEYSKTLQLQQNVDDVIDEIPDL